MGTSTTWNGYRISSKYLGAKESGWIDDNGKSQFRHFRVTVSKIGAGCRTSFDFWASIAHPRIEGRSDLLGAFECFLSDCISGLDSFEDFCGNFGYDQDSRKAEANWKTCKKHAANMKRIAGDEDLYKLANKLQEAQEAAA